MGVSSDFIGAGRDGEGAGEGAGEVGGVKKVRGNSIFTISQKGNADDAGTELGVVGRNLRPSHTDRFDQRARAGSGIGIGDVYRRSSDEGIGGGVGPGVGAGLRKLDRIDDVESSDTIPLPVPDPNPNSTGKRASVNYNPMLFK